MSSVSDTTWLDTVYGATAFATLLTGLLTLSAGIRPETIEPVVLLGATIVSMIGLYWLFGGERRET